MGYARDIRWPSRRGDEGLGERGRDSVELPGRANLSTDGSISVGLSLMWSVGTLQSLILVPRIGKVAVLCEGRTTWKDSRTFCLRSSSGDRGFCGVECDREGGAVIAVDVVSRSDEEEVRIDVVSEDVLLSALDASKSSNALGLGGIVNGGRDTGDGIGGIS